MTSTQDAPAVTGATNGARNGATTEAMTEVIPVLLADEQAPARPLVPSARELRLGGTLSVPAPELRPALDEDVARPTAREALAAFAHSLDPRVIAGPRLPLVVFAAGSFIGAWDLAALTTLLPNIQSSYHVSVRFLINLAEAMALVGLFIGPGIGWVVDRVKRLYLVIPGLILGSAARIAIAIPGPLSLLIGTRVGATASTALIGPAALPLLADYYPARSRARTYSLFYVAAALGTVGGPAISGVVGQEFGWRSVFVVVGVASATVTVFAFRLREPIRGALDRLDAGLDADTTIPPASWAESWRAATAVNTLRRLWYAVIFLVAGSVEVNGIILPFYYKSRFHLGAADRGFVIALGGMMGLAGLAASGPLAERLLQDRPARLINIFAAVFFLQGITFVAIGFSPFLWLTVLLSLPLSFAGALVTPGLTLLISLVVPARIRGFGIQTLSLFFVVGGILFLILYDGVFRHSGLHALFFVFAPVVAVGGFFLLGASPGLERDMRSAEAAAAADIEVRLAREAGRPKMLVCRDIDVDYDGVRVLFGVDFDVDVGEIVALLGTNGAGKSTLLSAISGINEPATGAVFLDGRDVTHMPADEKAARGVVMLPGGKAVFPTLTVEDNLRTATWLDSRGGADPLLTLDVAIARPPAPTMDEIFELFPVLGERRKELAGNLSGGEQQMLAVSQALLMRPRLLLIDELSLGLAPAIVGQLLETLREIAKRGTTMVLVEQSVNVALTVAERAVFMEKGEIRFDGPTAELLRRPDLARAVFMGNTASARGRLGGGEGRDKVDAGGRLLEVTGVSARFGGVTALSDVSITADAGQIVGIIGPNGAGKTTLMDAICGLIPISGGTVMIAGTDVTKVGAAGRARLGLARSFQDVRLFPALTVHETIAVAFERHLGMRSSALAAVWAPQVRTTERRIERRVQRVLSILGLEAYANKFVNELSTGSRRMVDIGCVLAAEPKVLLLDEPASGLAQAETEELAPILRRLVAETGCTAVVIEHDMPLITAVSDRLVAMDLGRVLAAGPVAEVIDHPDVVRSYLAASDDVIVRSGATAESVVHLLGKKGEHHAANPASFDE